MLDVPWDDLIKLDNQQVSEWFQEAKRTLSKAVIVAAWDLYDAHAGTDADEQDEKLLQLLIACDDADKARDSLAQQEREFFERRQQNRIRARAVKREALQEERAKREEAWTRGLSAAQVRAIRKAHRNPDEIPLVPIRETRDQRIRNDQLRSPGFISLRSGTPSRKDKVERMVE
jgi:hypothetical protein